MPAAGKPLWRRSQKPLHTASRVTEAPPAERVYIGIDPGASGGMVALVTRGGRLADPPVLQPLGGTDRDVWEWLAAYSEWRDGGTYAVIEKVGGWTGGRDGYAGNQAPGSMMFKFGRGVGFLHGCLVAAGIPYDEVTPREWQKGLGVPPRGKGETKTAWKNRLRQQAERLFPGHKVTLAVSDALLMAEYCRRKQEGLLV